MTEMTFKQAVDLGIDPDFIRSCARDAGQSAALESMMVQHQPPFKAVELAMFMFEYALLHVRVESYGDGTHGVQLWDPVQAYEQACQLEANYSAKVRAAISLKEENEEANEASEERTEVGGGVREDGPTLGQYAGGGSDEGVQSGD